MTGTTSADEATSARRIRIISRLVVRAVVSVCVSGTCSLINITCIVRVSHSAFASSLYMCTASAAAGRFRDLRRRVLCSTSRGEIANSPHCRRRHCVVCCVVSVFRVACSGGTRRATDTRNTQSNTRQRLLIIEPSHVTNKLSLVCKRKQLLCHSDTRTPYNRRRSSLVIPAHSHLLFCD